MPPAKNGGAAWLRAVRAALTSEGLNIVVPVGQVAFDSVCAAAGAPLLGALLDRAMGAIVVGDGGPTFFSRFQVARNVHLPGSDPLDDYTRLRVSYAVRVASDRVNGVTESSVAYRILFPFADRPVLPFQRIGQAAGLPPPGPLGIQVHPTYGPWWAYRALVVVSARLDLEAALPAPCAACPRPCVTACPGRAVAEAGFLVDRCTARRRLDPGCRGSCVARTHCPVGKPHRYPQGQVSFHMNASFAQIQRWRGGDERG